MSDKKPFWVTVYCDASFRKPQSGWGCWIKSSKTRVIKSGKTKDPSCSASAEMYAAFKAISLVLATHNPKEITGILINSDCQCVVDHLNFKNHSKKSNNKKIHEYKTLILGILNLNKIKIKTKHVKAHQVDRDIRTYLNNQVDKISKV